MDGAAETEMARCGSGRAFNASVTEYTNTPSLLAEVKTISCTSSPGRRSLRAASPPLPPLGTSSMPGMRLGPRVHVCTTVRSVISTSGDKKITTIGWYPGSSAQRCRYPQTPPFMKGRAHSMGPRRVCLSGIFLWGEGECVFGTPP